MNFHNLDINLLLVLDALLKERNVTLAAQKLSVSQPTVSFSLKKLREAFGDELFVRTASGMQPTPVAEGLADPLTRMFDILKTEILSRQEFDPAASARTFVINTTDIGEIFFLPPILHRLRAYAPHAVVQCVCLPQHEAAQAMSSGAVDITIGYIPELKGSSIFVQRLFEHPFTCLVREGHPGIPGPITLAQYRTAEHIALVGEGHDQKRFETMIGKAEIARRVTFRSPHFSTIPFIVRDTDLIATIPKVIPYLFAEIKGLRVMPVPFALPPIPIKQYWHQKANADPAHAWLRQNIADLFLNKDPTTSMAV
jgi:DNA-binding transcriptional LysR family regulator